ncbi:hypothetical protein BO94DRAFT_573661 [Aspergillus sclerotioniger CBS 115572]|uniref:Uncharacterized protein n=1 Tax=Aspergillus sclerotioniger CBS 115572 TaxID=1450535 RepID=A0A317WZT7_9EURO|nr:hypothetical protein BO94DRAFT_573661 [Aspergillus sclerotioniger CBS 115572]PWY91873.1 hypothetical protein BO94DRAFT_573661 [Aspergillus sclerotioniger CBS 115572]
MRSVSTNSPLGVVWYTPRECSREGNDKSDSRQTWSDLLIKLVLLPSGATIFSSTTPKHQLSAFSHNQKTHPHFELISIKTPTMRYFAITALLLALSGFITAHPADDSIFNALEGRCQKAGNRCDPGDSACCGDCCAFCTAKRDDDAVISCSYTCESSC